MNIKMRKLFWPGIFLCLLFLSTNACAQSGLVVQIEKSDNPVKSGFLIELFRNGNFIISDTTNIDGYCQIMPLDPNTYNVKISKINYTEFYNIYQIPSSGNLVIKIELLSNVILSANTVKVSGVQDRIIFPPIILTDQGMQIRNPINSPNTGLAIISTLNSQVNKTAAGYSVRGTRPGASATYIDGMRVIGSGSNLPVLGLTGIDVYVSGISPQFGDLTGGAFNYITGATSKKLTGILQSSSSQGLDAFGHTTIEGFVSGPLITSHLKNQLNKTVAITKLGFVLSGNVNFYKDPSPGVLGVYTVKPEVWAKITNTPLIYTPNGFVHAANFLTQNDFNHSKTHPNSATRDANFMAKLEYRPSKNTELTVFGNYYRFSGLSASTNPFMYYANAKNTNETYRSYLRFIQRFPTNGLKQITNAFYTIRADYQSSSSETMDATHGRSLFDYGYIGAFNRYYTEAFQYENTDIQQNPNKSPITVKDQYGRTVVLRNYWEQTGFADTALTFTASNKNPIRARYTQNIYDFYNTQNRKIRNATEVIQNQGLLNGYEPGSIYSLYQAPGGFSSSYSKSNYVRYSFTASGQMQYKPFSVKGIDRASHSVQFGLYAEQSIARGYSVAANQLWILMNQYMNKHLGELDKEHPILSYDANGIFTDTIRYNRLINLNEQSSFDRKFRNKLISHGGTDIYGKPIGNRSLVDINSYDPSSFSLDLFNANELLNDGNGPLKTGYANWFGYDYLGNKIRKKTSVSDFVNDIENRSSGAFSPIYLAGWIEDKFSLKDIIIRAGLRLEHYDANQKVLKDPYSLYPIKTAAEVKTIDGKAVEHPSNIGEDYAVYVDNLKNPTQILGYRKDDLWYDRFGAQIKNPQILSDGYTGTDGVKYENTQGRIAPLLSNPNQQNISESSFKDYKSTVQLLPRIWISFPLTKNRNVFYASFDQLSQRPQDGASFVQIADLYFLKNKNNATIANGDLKPCQKTDYEVGYKQLFGKYLQNGLELSMSYSEVRNNFGLYQVNQAYPVTYTTYRNIDYSSILGFTSRIVLAQLLGKNGKAGPLSLSAHYLLQFADGTGSNINSQQALIASNQPNLRNSIPLGELDIRNTLKFLINFDWQGGIDFKSKQKLYTGPMVFGKPILQNTSINLIANMSSGAPYTATTVPAQLGVTDRAPIKGVPFGSRMPWQFFVDLNVTKGFMVKTGGKPLAFQWFLNINNVFNRKNIVNVFRYTGLPADDGYLNSPNGKITVDRQLDAQSFANYYQQVLNTQSGNFANPRMSRMGLRLILN